MKNFLFLLLCLPLICHAEIFKSVDANGDVTYSDRPTSQNSTEVTLPSVNSSPASSSSSDSSRAEQTKTLANTSDTGNKPYTKFEIVSPKDQESIQNQPQLAVKLGVEPDLQQGDVIQVYVDGGPIGNAMHQTSFDFTIPYRGTHVLSATLFDKDMKMLRKANSITIYVHQAHIGSPAS